MSPPSSSRFRRGGILKKDPSPFLCKKTTSKVSGANLKFFRDGMKDVWGIRFRREIARKGVSISRVFFACARHRLSPKAAAGDGEGAEIWHKREGNSSAWMKGGEQTMT